MSSIFLACALLFYIKYQNATRDWGDTLVGFRCESGVNFRTEEWNDNHGVQSKSINQPPASFLYRVGKPRSRSRTLDAVVQDYSTNRALAPPPSPPPRS